MMSAGEAFSEAWQIYREELVAWAVFSAVPVLVGTLIPVVGALVLLPNVLREAEAAIAARRAPEVGAIFSFDEIGRDLVTSLLYLAAQGVGALFCCIGQPIAWLFCWYSLELSADGRVSPVDALRASAKWVGQNLGPTLTMALVSVALNSLGASLGFGFGVFLTMPLVFIAWSIHWADIRAEVHELAAEQGLDVAPAEHRQAGSPQA